VTTLCSESSADVRASLEEQKTEMEKQLTDECARLRRELDRVGGEKKDAEIKFEDQRKTLNEQMDRHRKGI